MATPDKIPPPDNALQPQQDQFKSELAKAVTSAIHGRSWIPYLRLLFLLVAVIATVVITRQILP